ncbi:hypothetical protein H9Q70_000696 [Fusarium xylarioides]|nr:hypothetical protein H9Q70_000696 [Fusarium xylarioides]KAG5777123.1 hypothetical protein H9Q73_009209 [Fusarium xylarioides]
MRLLSKSKLSVKELDAAVFCRRTREIQTLDETLNNRDLFSISPLVVTDIAAVVELDKLSGLEILSLLPIWGVMDSFGLISFFRCRFLTRNLAQIDPIFASPITSQSGLGHIEYLAVNGEVTNIKNDELGICAGFHWPLEHFQSLLTATGLQEAKLTPDTFLSLYRHALLCQILEVSPKDCIKLYGIIRQSEEKDVFQDLTTTYAIVKRWKSLFERAWTVESLATTLQISDEHGIAETPNNVALKTILATQNGAKDLQKSLVLLFTRNIAQDKAIVDCVSHLFEAEVAKIVVGFVQGTQVNTETVTVGKEEYQTLLKSSAAWPTQLSMIPKFGRDSIQLQLLLTGVLSSEDTTTLRGSTSGSIKQRLTIIIKQSLMPLKIILPRFATCQESRTKLDSGVFDQEWQTLPQLLGEGSSEQPGGQHEGQQYATDDGLQSLSQSEISSKSRARREAFVNISSPTIIQERLANLVINSVQDHIINDLEPSLLNLLLTEVLQIKRGDITQSAITILQQLEDVGAAPGIDANSLNVFFVPNRADIFTFHFDQSAQEFSPEKETDADNVPTPEETPQLRINGISLPYNKVNVTWAAIRLTAGQPYHLQARFSASNL